MSGRDRANGMRVVGICFYVVSLAMLLSACSSGGDGGGGTPPAAAPLNGVIVDSRVANLGYMTDISGLFGRTDATGHFQYMPGDKVKFFLDDPAPGSKPVKRQIGPAAGVNGAPEITALQLFGVTDRTDTQVSNLCRLLGTVSQTGLPASGTPIQLPATLPAALPPTLPSFTSTTFDMDIQNAGYPLTVTVRQADTHLSGSLPTMTVNFAGPGSGTVSATPTGTSPGITNCGAATCKGTFVSGTSVTLTETSNAFGGWSLGTGDATCNNNAATCTVTVTQDSSITATFNPAPATLTVLPNGGTGTGTVGCSTTGGAPFAPCGTYPGGTMVAIQATATQGSSFTTWTDGTASAAGCNTVNPCSVTLNANSQVRANFALNSQPVSLGATTASATQGGGTVGCSTTGPGGPFTTPCAVSYNAGTNLTLQATANSVSNFTGWGGGTGNAAPCNSSTNPLCTVQLTANSAVTANFNRPTLSVVVVGTGTVTSTNSAGINCGATCAAPFDKNTSITLAAGGTGFTSWGGCTPVSGTPTQCTVAVTVDTTVTATFGNATKAEHALAQTGLAIALASTVLQSQVQILVANVLQSTGCSVLTGGGSVQGNPTAKTVTVYYDTACTQRYIVATPVITQTTTSDGPQYAAVETATYYGLGGAVIGTMSLNETAANITATNTLQLYGTGTFTPAGVASTPVQLGLYCSIPNFISTGPVPSPQIVQCGGGVAQDFPALNLAIGAVTPLTLTINLDPTTGQPTNVTFVGGGSAVTGPLGSLTLTNPSPTSLVINGGSAFTTTTAGGGAAAFALFPPTPTSWDLTDATHDEQLHISVIDNTTRNLSMTITRKSSGSTLATAALDKSGTGGITYSDGSTAAITSWTLAN